MKLYTAYAVLYPANTPWNGPVGDALIRRLVARDEEDARRIVIEHYKAKGVEARPAFFTLLRENVTATREQELEALAAIKQMVDDLGPKSIVAAGMKAGIEEAEKNIRHELCLAEFARCEKAARFLVKEGTI